jgi:hypothetical protein
LIFTLPSRWGINVNRMLSVMFTPTFQTIKFQIPVQGVLLFLSHLIQTMPRAEGMAQVVECLTNPSNTKMPNAEIWTEDAEWVWMSYCKDSKWGVVGEQFLYHPLDNYTTRKWVINYELLS